MLILTGLFEGEQLIEEKEFSILAANQTEAIKVKEYFPPSGITIRSSQKCSLILLLLPLGGLDRQPSHRPGYKVS